MGMHLRVERWFDRTSTGALKRKRVSAKREKQFPRELREMYQFNGTVALIRRFMANGQTLAQAWAEVKRMFND